MKRNNAKYAPHTPAQLLKKVKREIIHQVVTFDSLEDGSLADVAGMDAKRAV
jgi:hypothetical protein